jgi:tRNA nucleotidyltransferase (CCA-adding enzyme)
MAKYRSPGKTSSLSAASAKRTLAAKCAALPLRKLIPAIGADSNLVIVGGSVREALLGNKNSDLDLASVLTPLQVKKRLAKGKIRVYQTGMQHGTVTAVIGKENIEITTFRKPGKKSAFSKSLLEDLKARDFTINAGAFDVVKKEIIDPLNAVSDIKKGIVRACGDASKRFKEDPLRILRMVRFGPAAGRKIENKTLKAALKLSFLLKKISIERIRLELERILMGSDPAAGIRALAKYDLLKYVVPELIPSIGFEQNKFHTQDVFEHTLSVIQNTPQDLRLRLAALFHDIGKPESFSVGDDGERHFYLHENIGHRMCKKVMKRLRFSNQEIKAVSQLVRLHMRPLDCGPAGVRRLMRDLGEYFEDWKKLKAADSPPTVPKKEFKKQFSVFMRMVNNEIKRLTKSQGNKLAINGHDLITLGEKPGKRLGSILKSLENIVIENPELNDHTILIEKAKEIIKSTI